MTSIYSCIHSDFNKTYFPFFPAGSADLDLRSDMVLQVSCPRRRRGNSYLQGETPAVYLFPPSPQSGAFATCCSEASRER